MRQDSTPRTPTSPPSGARRVRATVLLLAAAGTTLVAVSCASGAPTREEVRSHMFNAMWRMGSIPSRLVVGDLEGVRRPAGWLAAQIEAEEMMGSETRRTRMRALAEEVEGATSVAGAARSASLLAAECGTCHEEVDGGPVFGESDGIPVGSRLSTHMLRHIWAADRMWEGLMDADPTRWELGAAVLAEDPLRFFERMDDVPGVARYARRIHELGEEAMALTDRGERALVYGELVATCAGCHEAMDVPRR